jgi:hypothetical protein
MANQMFLPSSLRARWREARQWRRDDNGVRDTNGGVRLSRLGCGFSAGQSCGLIGSVSNPLRHLEGGGTSDSIQVAEYQNSTQVGEPA